jgi:DNA-binding transcriptional ArsR family regulator
MTSNDPSHRTDLITHPVRMRILLALVGADRTAQGIAALVEDVPASSIYRHLHILIDAGLIEVVAERRVRGALERTLRLREGAASLDPDQTEALTPDDYRRMFAVFVTHLLHEWQRYVAQPDFDPLRDLTGFRTAAFHASDDEWRAAIEAINAALLPLIGNEPRGDRRLRRIASVSLIAETPQEHQA